MKFINRHSRVILPLLAFLVVTGGLLYAPAAHAGWADAVSIVLGNLISLFVTGLGSILIVLVYILLWISQYNDFINSAAVTNGWSIVRDICNMFFILILLIIAFATVLNQESYSWKKMLPKLLIMAVLINFSKLICGVILDFAQVVMLTFVNGFRDIGGGNLTHMLGINDLLDLRPSENDKIDLGSILGSYLLALLYVLVAIVVITVILFVLIMRMVMLWILIVLSPLPFLLQVLPNTKKYGDMWWKRFTENVVAGPILAFFIWLSFASVTVTTTGTDLVGNLNPPNATENETARITPNAGLSTSGTPDGMLKFVISIGLLIGGLMITKEFGSAIGGAAGKGMAAITGGAKSMSGYNAVKDRIGAFNKNRQAARTEKINAFGERAFGGYLSAKKGIQGGVKTAYAGAKQGVKSAADGTVTAAAKGLNIVGGKIPHRWTGALVSDAGDYIAQKQQDLKMWKENRKEKKNVSTMEKKKEREHKERLKEAYLTGVYKDGDGNEYKEEKYTDANGKSQIRYMRDIKDELGNVTGQEEAKMTYKELQRDRLGKPLKDADGKYKYEEKTETVKKMSDFDFKTSTAWKSATAEAKAYNNRKEKDRVTKEKDKMADADFSVGQISAVLKDQGKSNTQRLAAALSLAVKQGFKDRSHMKEAQGLLAHTNNAMLTKQFEEDGKKKQAHLMYDLETEGGRKKLAKDKVDGKFDVLQAGAYKDPRVIQALSDGLSEKAYVSYMRKVKETDSKSDENQGIGQNAYLDQFQAPPIDPKTGNPHKSRKSVVELSGNLANGLRGVTDVNEIKNVVTKLLQGMTKSQIADMDPHSFKIDKSIFTTSAQQDSYKGAVVDYFKKLKDDNQINGIANTRNAKQETIDAIKAIAGVPNSVGTVPPAHNWS